jgi:hypothetical protein
VRAQIRGLRARLYALSAVAVAVAAAAAAAALAVTAWSAALPLGARADLAGSPADYLVVSTGVVGPAGYAADTRTVEAAAARDAPGLFAIEQAATSEPYDLPDGANGSAQASASTPGETAPQTYVVAAPPVQAHARLSEGTWPGAATVAGALGPEVPVALPDTAAGLLGLRLGSTLTMTVAPHTPATTFVVVGVFRYLGAPRDRAALAWNQIGPAGAEFTTNPPGTLYGPLVAAPAAFTDGPVPYDTGFWTLTPIGAPGLSAVQKAVQAVTSDPNLTPALSYTTDAPATGEVAVLARRVTVARGELLAAAVLLGLLAGLALAAAVGNLIDRGAAQTALMRSRGAPAAKLAAVHLPDAALLFLAAALGTAAQGPLIGRALLRVPPLTPTGGGAGLGLPAADWLAGLCVACVAAGFLLLRAARAAPPAQVAAATGRQSAASGLARAGADLALTGLAAVALIQAANTGLTATGTDGGSGVVLIVACAPALATAAGAALCGRLVGIAARLSERFAGRARALPSRLAAWELARTPQRHLIAALLSVAAVAGCGYAAAEHTSWERSAHDQAAFQVGADVAVDLGRPQPLAAGAALTRGQGIDASTPVFTSMLYGSVPQQGPLVIGVDARTAAQTVDLRPDQADRPIPALWSAITPSAEPGLALPGRPTGLGVQARLTGKLADPTVTLVVEDATGIAYSVPLGGLPADGAAHTLAAQIAPTGSAIAYPLRLIGVSLGYQLPALTPVGADFSLAALTARDAGSSAYTPVAGALDAVNAWTPGSTFSAAGAGGLSPPTAATRRIAPGLGADTRFSSGQGLAQPAGAFTLTAPVLPGTATAAVLPGIATAAYLRANQETVGSEVTAEVDQTPVRVQIVAQVTTFPTLTAPGDQALIVDLGDLSDLAQLKGDPLAPVSLWWLHTAHGATPPVLPVAATATNTGQSAASLTGDPLAAVPQRVLTVGAAALVLLALLGLLISLLAAAREAAARDSVLSALGMTRSQRAALGALLHTAVATPAAVLGAGLGFLLARLLVPVFTLSSQAVRPDPPATVLFAAPWSLLAAAAVVACTALAALAVSARRRDPSAASRPGG